MIWLRLTLIVVGLIFISEIPSTEKVFFNARFAFYGMLLLDFINVFKSNEGFEKHYSGFGMGIVGFITFLDLLGVLDIIQLDNNLISPNDKYTLINWIPHIPVEAYIVTVSGFTIFICAAEIVIILARNKYNQQNSGNVLET
ncbi:hypothetical protein SLL00_16595 [Metabacillus indicus]|uniref:hypothetical protein n=1 Tax=Metabacillus indicus TaxID=246786 RepID=UPI002A088654|nr:hypothetical protein [Metabacillus indicus]MDX8291431.1 hypothetical protein [Metabacillus indicus]